MAKDFGRRFTDFRVNTINPGVAQFQAGSAAEQQLRAESAAQNPDFANVLDLISKEDMHTFDREADVAALGQMQSQFFEAAQKDPFVMFSREGKQLASQVNRFLNDPQRKRKVEAFKFNQESIKQAQKDGQLRDIYVSGGVIGGPEGLPPGTLANSWQVADQMKGGNFRLNFSQNTHQGALKNVQNALANAGQTSTTGFRNFDGEALGIQEGTMIEKVMHKGNEQQVAAIVQGMVEDGMIAGSDWDALLSKAAGEILQSGQYDPATLQDEASRRAIGYIQTIGRGQTDSINSRSLSNIPGLAGGGAGGKADRLSGFTDQAVSRNKDITMITSGGTGLQFQAGQHDLSALIGKGRNGSSLLGENTWFNNLGAANHNMSIGMPGETGTKMSSASMDYIRNHAELSGEGAFYFDTYAIGDQQVSADDVEFIQNIQKSGMSPQDKRNELASRGLQNAVPRKFAKMEVQMPQKDFLLISGDDSKVFDEIESAGIESSGTYSEEDILRYRDRIKLSSSEELNEGSDKYSFSLYFPVNSNFDVESIQGFDSGKNRVINVAGGTLNFDNGLQENTDLIFD